MRNVWISTDLHLLNDEITSHHPYRSIGNIGRLTDGYAKDVQVNDVFIYLGDLYDPSAGDPKKIKAVISAIPGYKIMCKGNHDTECDSFYQELGFDLVCDVATYHNIAISHKPIIVPPDMVNIHGHVHTEKFSYLGHQHINAYDPEFTNHPTLIDDLLAKAESDPGETKWVKNPWDYTEEKTAFESFQAFDKSKYFNVVSIDDIIDADVPVVELEESVLTEGTAEIIQLKKMTSPTDLSDWMKKNIKYASFSRLMTTSEILKKKRGSCHDQVAFEFPILKGMDISPKVLFMIATKPDSNQGGMTHSLVYWEDANEKVYWFENAWTVYQGIHKYESYDKMKEDIEAQYAKTSGSKQFPELVFKKTSIAHFKPGTDLKTLVDGIMNNKILEAAIAVHMPTQLDEVIFQDVDDVEYFEQDDEYKPSSRKKEPMADGEGTMDESALDAAATSVLKLSDYKQIANSIAAKVKRDRKKPTGNQNCKLCTWCAEAQCRGINILPRPIYSPRDIVLPMSSESLVISPKIQKFKSTEQVKKIVEIAGDGARFYIHVNWKGSSGGHEFMLVNIGGTAYILDTQCGLVTEMKGKAQNTYFNINCDNSYMFRMDNREFNQALFIYNSPKYLLPWDEEKDIAYLKSEGMISESIEGIEELLAEATIKVPKVLYHGSSKKFDVVKANSAYNLPSTAVEAGTMVAYGSPSYEFALCYAGDEWSDFDINQSVVNGQVVLTEILPGAFKDTFNRPGYIYHMNGADFIAIDKHSEFVCPHDVIPTKIEKISNVWSKILKSNIKLHMYPDLPHWIPNRAEYLKNLCVKYGRDYNKIVAMLKAQGVQLDEAANLSGINLAHPGEMPHIVTDEEHKAHRQAVLEFIDEAAYAHFEKDHTSIKFDPGRFKVYHLPKDKAKFNKVFSPGNEYQRKLYQCANEGKWPGQKDDEWGKGVFVIDAVTGYITGWGFVFSDQTLANVDVLDGYRGMGIGSAIVKELKDMGGKYLAVNRKNKVALEMYKKLGYKAYYEDKSNIYLSTTGKPAPEDEEMLKNSKNGKLLEDAADVHPIDREQQDKIADKYGLRSPGHTTIPDDEPKKSAAQIAREKREAQRKKDLEKARKEKQKKAFVSKLKTMLPGKKNEDADAAGTEWYDEPEIEENPLGARAHFFNHPDRYTEVIAETGYKFELIDNVTFYDKVNEAAAADDKLYPVYIMLVHSGTLLANAIKFATNSHFSHSSISFDSSMHNMYSFGRKENTNPFIGAFKREDIRDKFFKERQIAYALYVVPCTKEELDLMKKRLDYFIRNSSKFKYDFTGLFKNYFGVADNPEYKWFCSRFVADIINAGRPMNPYVVEPSLMKPEDFSNTTFAQYVTGGYISSYDSGFVDRVTKRILRTEKLKRAQNKALESMQNETAILDVDPYNPFLENTINIQLSRMDESVVDNFVEYMQSMKVRFDNQGNVIITRRETDQLSMHFKRSLKMIKTCEKAGNVEGVKEELYRINYMINLIDTHYLNPKVVSNKRVKDDLKKEMVDLRSVMLNALGQHLKYVTTREPQYNFKTSYEASVYGKDVVIPKTVYSSIGKAILTALK